MLPLQLWSDGSQRSQRSQLALTLEVPTLTSISNGTTEIITSPVFLASADSLVTRSLAAVFSAPILPELAIDPVLSRTSATRSRLAPQLAVELASKFMFGRPASFMKSVVIDPVPVTTTVALL